MRFARTLVTSLVILSSIMLVSGPASAMNVIPGGGGGGAPPAVLGPKVIVGTTYSQYGDPKNMDHMFVKWSKVKGAAKYTRGVSRCGSTTQAASPLANGGLPSAARTTAPRPSPPSRTPRHPCKRSGWVPPSAAAASGKRFARTQCT
jgi:hypothetical protein